MKAWDKRTTILITSFERPKALGRLLRSLLRYQAWGDYVFRILVVDDSNKKPGVPSNVDLHYMPFDSGLSAKRNEGVLLSDTEYVVIMDDDFEVTAGTRLDRFATILDAVPDAGIVGGPLDDVRRGRIPFWGTLRQEGKVLHFDNAHYGREIVGGILAYRCDMTSNFAMGRRTVFKQWPWREYFKVSEHLLYYHDFLASDWSVLHTDAVTVRHHGDRPKGYGSYRYRAVRLLMDGMKEMGIAEYHKYNSENPITMRSLRERVRYVEAAYRVK